MKKKIALGVAGALALIVIVLMLLPGPSRKGLPEQAYIFHNANVITVDAKNPRAEAVAVAGGKIVFVGSSKDALALALPGAKKIDLKGKTVIPGFNDNHAHTLAAGNFYLQPLLWGKTCEEIAAVVKAEAAKKKPGELVLGNSWDYDKCPKPDKALLDAAAPDNPVFLMQYSGHAAWANSKKLKDLGIDRNTPDPKGGQIVRNEKGEPTGVLRDEAMGSSAYGDFLKALLSDERHRAIIDKALQLYRENGITSVQDNTWEPFTNRLLYRYDFAGTLTTRFDCWAQGDSVLHTLFNWFAKFDDPWVTRGPVKYFSDGAFSTRTGWLTAPYADEPGNYGSPRYTPEELTKIIMDAAATKTRLAFHAIGDRAITEVLNAIEKAQEKYPWTKDLRMRIEHVQIMKPADIERMKRLGVVACVQPFAACNPEKDVKLLGQARARTAYPYKSMLAAGVPVAIGSDAPAEVDFQPLLNIYYAVTRKTKDGAVGPLNAAECLTPEEALYCYTMGSAYAQFMENEKGSLTKGKLADLVVLSKDLTRVAPNEIKGIEVLATVTGGRIVYDKGALQ
ncbi:MAG: amidohydrolase [Spirochaetes bacterium]|nr:MAG: amidohydrolase [Spirochaetota bacterium]